MFCASYQPNVSYLTIYPSLPVLQKWIWNFIVFLCQLAVHFANGFARERAFPSASGAHLEGLCFTPMHWAFPALLWSRRLLAAPVCSALKLSWYSVKGCGLHQKPFSVTKSTRREKHTYTVPGAAERGATREVQAGGSSRLTRDSQGPAAQSSPLMVGG